jgi:exosortase/archaeosortase family protein
MTLLVEEACSGMRSVMAMLTLALIVIYFVKLRTISKLALAAISVFVAIVLNVFRVASTGLLAHFVDPQTATGFFHTFSGMIVFIVGLPILYYSGIALTKFESTNVK